MDSKEPFFGRRRITLILCRDQRKASAVNGSKRLEDLSKDQFQDAGRVDQASAFLFLCQEEQLLHSGSAFPTTNPLSQPVNRFNRL
jgi:hypothetical protein